MRRPRRSKRRAGADSRRSAARHLLVGKRALSREALVFALRQTRGDRGVIARGEAKALPARRRRVGRASLPSDSTSSTSTLSYSAGSTTTAANALFLAAARIIVGPPMSMFSTISSAVASPRATVCSNGYRFTHTRSTGSIECSAAARRCSSLSRTASNPAYRRGCSVLTRPSIISGKPVKSSTARTGDASLGQGACGAASRDDLHAQLDQATGKVDDAGLVRDRKQRSAHSHRTWLGALDAGLLPAQRSSSAQIIRVAPRPRAGQGSAGVL